MTLAPLSVFVGVPAVYATEEICEFGLKLRIMKDFVGNLDGLLRIRVYHLLQCALVNEWVQFELFKQSTAVLLPEDDRSFVIQKGQYAAIYGL